MIKYLILFFILPLSSLDIKETFPPSKEALGIENPPLRRMRIDKIVLQKFSHFAQENNDHVENGPDIYPALHGPTVGIKCDRGSINDDTWINLATALAKNLPGVTSVFLPDRSTSLLSAEDKEKLLKGTSDLISSSLSDVRRQSTCDGRISFPERIGTFNTVNGAQEGKTYTFFLEKRTNFVSMEQLFFLVFYDLDRKKGNRDDRMLYLLLNPTLLIEGDGIGISNLNPSILLPGDVQITKRDLPNSNESEAVITFRINALHGGASNRTDWIFDMYVSCS